MYPCILSKVFTWVKTHGYCGIEHQERGENIWAFIWCWDNNQFRQVWVSILDPFISNVNEEVAVLGWVIDALGPNVCIVSMHSGSHALVEAYVNYFGSGDQQKLI